jgi:hypothetical protein
VALVGVRGVGHRARLRQGEHRGERVAIRAAQVLGFGGQHRQVADRQDRGQQHREHDRRVEQPAEADRQVAVQQH